MELWGGIECTLNRVGDRYIDQLTRNGHLQRPEDFELIAGLGIQKLRYPIHWERVQANSPRAFDWSVPDRCLEASNRAGLQPPIAGLVHHGSGPSWTNLLDPDFSRRLADFAFAVAQRYPWLRDYTPVNEPLTTARFSCLYGHWYPHRKDDRAFGQAMLNQLDGVRRAMAAIRTIRADARLIQTEDLGKVYSTPTLDYQAAFENERRWITFDMLAGRFNDQHPLWSFLLHEARINRAMLESFVDSGCPPDVFGINYYVTSERWIDGDLSRYPESSHGGNGREAYADIAAVRGSPDRMAGIEKIVSEAWARYQAPLAITECHLGCTRDEQLRWLMETWQAAQRLARSGVDVRALTVWALFGAFDWNSLVTVEAGLYEAGAFDLRGRSPRMTQIGKAVRTLAQAGEFNHPILLEDGWWRRAGNRSSVRAGGRSGVDARPILVFGGAGNLARALQRVCHSRALTCRNLSRGEADVCDSLSLERAIERHRPWAVVNASGYSLIDEAEADADRCFEINHGGAANAASACAKAGLPYVMISTDLVFDGAKPESYLESDATLPLSVYGRSKEKGEQAILRRHPDALVIRAAPLFDAWSAGHFAARVLLEELPVLPTGRISPTYSLDLCQGLLDLLIDEESGIWHLANVGAVSWPEFAELLLNAFSLPVRELRGQSAIAPRPLQSVLASERGCLMPPLADAIARFADEFRPLMRHRARACESLAA